MFGGVVVAEAPAAVDDDDAARFSEGRNRVRGGRQSRLVDRLRFVLVGDDAPAEFEDDEAHDESAPVSVPFPSSRSRSASPSASASASGGTSTLTPSVASSARKASSQPGVNRSAVCVSGVGSKETIQPPPPAPVSFAPYAPASRAAHTIESSEREETPRASKRP